MEYKEFKKELTKINKNKAAEELMWWLNEKIETYIDNHLTTYSLSFLADQEKTPELHKIEALGYSLTAIQVSSENLVNLEDEIENNEEVASESHKIKLLNSFMEEIKEIAINDKKRMDDFFNSLLFYYSTVAFYKGKPVSKDMNGYIDIQYFSFENISMDVFKTQLIPVYNKGGEVIDYKKDDSNKTLVGSMPPSFVIDFEIVFWENKQEVSIF
jgi:hypothetical protein